MRSHSLCIVFGIIWHRTLAAENITSLLPVSTSARPTKVHNRITVIDEKSTTVDIFENSKSRRDEKENVSGRTIIASGGNAVCAQSASCLTYLHAVAIDLNVNKDAFGLSKIKTIAIGSTLTISTLFVSWTTFRYYYQPRLDRCVTFKFSGCAGNQNQFDTKKDCERHCLGAGLMYQERIDPFMACEMQPSGGVCLGYMTRMYFDINDSKCKTFLYSGCGGNPNNFETTAECMKTCTEDTPRKGKSGPKAGKGPGSGSDEAYWLRL